MQNCFYFSVIHIVQGAQCFYRCLNTGRLVFSGWIPCPESISVHVVELPCVTLLHKKNRPWKGCFKGQGISVLATSDNVLNKIGLWCDVIFLGF